VVHGHSSGGALEGRSSQKLVFWPIGPVLHAAWPTDKCAKGTLLLRGGERGKKGRLGEGKGRVGKGREERKEEGIGTCPPLAKFLDPPLIGATCRPRGAEKNSK